MNKNVEYRFLLEQTPKVSACDLATVKPPYVHFKRKYPEFIMYLILSGEMQIFENEREYCLRENDLLLLDPSCVHFGTKPISCSFYYIHFSLEGLKVKTGKWENSEEIMEEERKSKDGKWDDFPKYFHLENSHSIKRLHQIFETIRFHYPKPNHFDQAMINCLCQELLILLASDYAHIRHSENGNSLGKVKHVILELQLFLQTEYATSITGNLLQETFSYHFDYLNRQFKIFTGDSIFRYLTTIRIEKAKELLKIGYLSMEEIANQTGFCDSFYFSKVFKKETGVTPGKWKKENQILS